MKKLHTHFIHHLRSYRTFNFMFFSFLLLITSFTIYFASNRLYAENVQKDLLEQAFAPAMSNETIINLWQGKTAVGNEVLREGMNVQGNFWQWCFVNNDHISNADLSTQKTALWSTLGDREFCEQILGGDYDTTVLKTEPPLIVRIAKFLLRITMILSVTMVIYNGIMWIIESSRWAEVKDAKKNITLIVVGILISLMSLMIINLISSITISSLGTNSEWGAAWCSINGSVLIGDDLKEYICQNSFYGKRYGDRVGNRCRVDYYRNNPNGNFDDGHRAPITDGEMVSKCIELWGTYTN
jgi:hypothetical protein